MTIILEVNEAGELHLPAEILGTVKPYTRYKVEATEAKIVIEPEEHKTAQTKTVEEWKKEWDQWVDRASKAALYHTSAHGKSALDELTDMRNARG